MKIFEELDYAYYTWFQEDKTSLTMIMCFALAWCAILNVTFGGTMEWYHVVNGFAWGIFGYYLNTMVTELARLIGLIFKKRR
jgi:hypothetical protein